MGVKMEEMARENKKMGEQLEEAVKNNAKNRGRSAAPNKKTIS